MDAEQKFKVGDRVTITKDGPFRVRKGDLGTIWDVEVNGRIWVEVIECGEHFSTYGDDIELLPDIKLTQEQETTAMKFDSGKPRVSLIPSIAIEKEGAVLGFGEQKYASHNWRKGMKYSKLIDSAIRHLLKLKEGEDLDPESGLPHWAHVRCNMGFLGEYMEYGLGEDDRFIRPKKKAE